MSKELGDFQTPTELVNQIVDFLTDTHKEWTRLLEPTCGRGNFIAGLLHSELGSNLQEIHGIEIQAEYCNSAEIRFQMDPKVTIHQADICTNDVMNEIKWNSGGRLLIVGNPPWVTNAALEVLGGSNMPPKSNIKGLRGLDALTGKSNFDLAEYIILKLIITYYSQHPTISMLCKTVVARNIIHYVAMSHLAFGNASIHIINSKKWFDVDVDACLFTFDIGISNPSYTAQVYSSLNETQPSKEIGVKNGHLIADISTYDDMSELDGRSPMIWRQGIKHDIASVVELTWINNKWYNKKLQMVDVEPEYIYPFMKSSDLVGAKKSKQRAIIVPQKIFGEDITHLHFKAPKLWAYLMSHQNAFMSRKSSIYINQPSFAYFGLGIYTFTSYKVAISGMYKQSLFKAIGPEEGKPVIFDDTCYLLACSSSYQAAFITALLNHPYCQQFIATVAFWDAKRPITKSLLQRIDLIALFNKVYSPQLLQQAENIRIQITPSLKDATISDTWPNDIFSLLNLEQTITAPPTLSPIQPALF